MGDAPSSSTSAGEYVSREGSRNGYPGTIPNEAPSSFPHGPSPVNNSAFQQQYQQPYMSIPNAFTNQFDMTHTQAPGRPGSFNMTAISNALPQPIYRQGYSPGQHQQRHATGPLNHGVVQAMAQYGLPAQPYYMLHHQQMAPYYNAHLPHQQQTHQANPRHNDFYSSPVMINQPQGPMQGSYYYQPTHQYPNANTSMNGVMNPSQFFMPDGSTGDVQNHSTPPGRGQQGEFSTYTQPGNTRDSRTNVVRGPPRKPQQSGHAIWIGNLPPQTELMNLVEHVCKEAEGLVSLFLISKSNCAFANFKDEQACVAAQQKLHDSKFQTVRLVSRLRKSTVEGASGQTAPTGPSATSPIARKPSIDLTANPHATETDSALSTTPENKPVGKSALANDTTHRKDKFFILKSLTVEDLELSIRNGVWATQSHNETSLNEAFESADNVYLVFSANKSGEYFGYARMISSINDDPAAAIEFAPKIQAASDLDLPKAIPTDATENRPRGRIIDDSARGTIFWEIERDESDAAAETESEDSHSVADGEAGEKAWGKPFKLEWLSTTRLPFYRTRGLRNPWNSNREVKIARDGTELEPSVGRKLIGLFNRVQSPPAPLPLGMRPAMPMVAGYPPQAPPPYSHR